MLRHGNAELLISFDQGEHCILVWRRVVAVDVGLYASIGRGSSIRKFLD